MRWIWMLPVAATLLAVLACSGGAEPTAEPARPIETSEALQRPTPTESSEESSGGFAGDTGSGETYGEYVPVTDDYQAIQVEVPAAWADVNGEPEEWDNGVEFASIWAAPDLNEFESSWGTPGVKFGVTADKEKIGGHIQVLDRTRTWEFLKACELDSREDYDDGYYRGAYDYYEDCDGTADYMILAAVPKQDSGDVLILLEVQIVSDADFDAAERILQTFDIIGSLP